MSTAPQPPHPCEHPRDYLGHAHDANARRTAWVVALTAAMMVAEIVAGYLTGSMALLADGFHMATHAGALGVAALAYRFARKHARNPRYSFGTGKVGDLAGFASALVLAIFAGAIALESARRLADPGQVAFVEAIWVAVLGLAVNLVSAWLLGGGHGHAHEPHHGHGHDNNLRAAYFHVLADALTSVLAIAALLAGRYLGWAWLDPAVGILGAIVIARWSWGLMRDTADMLLDVADPALAADVRSRVEASGDARVEDLHIWRIGPQAQAAMLTVAGTATAAQLRERLVTIAAIKHLTIERR
ncbi:CDF family Co(II)/Ni(II) efflux transporter DmeF [Sphingomonas japonica]|uniref:Cation diffusion facilitator family transporter n=1 Tax=Sphingomonas japonica TaxID=511662 RepID=A0ABX0U6I4_9SPHN|nr:CDF family Co(II)/Ni(II) efflux transporter DmeF [Sphingomonas japonica]NIJ24362.1 cation diffusion facilitator family transporter [Sphingomonas japonica]